MTVQDNSDLYTDAGVGVLAVLGAIAKSTQWRDPETGKINPLLMLSGVAVCLIMAAIIRAAGVHYGVEPWVQVAGSGVACYVGPDAIISGIAQMAMARFGIGGTNGKQPVIPPKQ